MNVQQLSPTHWRVDSESRDDVQYDVHQDGTRWTCSCPQNAILHRCCKHLAATWRYERECPACHGKGMIEITSFVWYDETGERSDNRLPCVICEGSGRRAKPLPASDLPSEAETRAIFA